MLLAAEVGHCRITTAAGWDLHLGVLVVGGPALVLVVRPGLVDRVGRRHMVWGSWSDGREQMAGVVGPDADDPGSKIECVGPAT